MEQIKILGNAFDVLTIGEDKLLLQLNKSLKQIEDSIPLISQTIVNEEFKQLENIVSSETELLLYCQQSKQVQLLKQLSQMEAPISRSDENEIFIDVCFELSEDWERVINNIGQDKETIIDEILKQSYRLINYGFQPGFMYLDGLDEKLHVPRLDNPRLEVPAGSLAIGGKYLGVYGSNSPGGWNIIGRTQHIYKRLNQKDLPKISQEIRFIRLTKEQYLRKHK